LVILTLTYNFNFHITYKKHEKNKYYSVYFITHEETPDSCGLLILFGLIREANCKIPHFLVLKLPLNKIFVEQIMKLSEKWGIKKLPKMLRNLQI